MALNLIGEVFDAEGMPLALGEVSVHGLRGSRMVVIGRGRVEAGRLQVDAELGPVWGLRIDGRAVLTWPQLLDGDTLQLAPLRLRTAPVVLPVAHALRSAVWGWPTALDARADAAPRPAATDATVTTRPPVQPTTATAALRPGVPISTLLGNAATQIREVSLVDSGLQFGTTSLKLTGIASSDGDVIGIKFPELAEELAAGSAMSELSVTFTSPGPPPAPPAPVAPTPLVPDVGGYTRELALRKLAAQRYTAQVRTAGVADVALQGKVLRQLPRAGEPLVAGSTVVLFIAGRVPV